MMAALTLTALAVVHFRRTPVRATIVHGLAIVIGSWAYFGVYYTLTQPPFFGDVATRLGLFLVCLLVFAGLVVLVRGTTPSLLRLSVLTSFAGGFTILGINAVSNVFPGTASTHPRLLWYVAPLTILVAFAVWGFPLAIDDVDVGPVVLALFLGPLMFVGFAVIAELNSAYQYFAARGQTFIHLSAVIMAAIAVVDIGWRSRPRASFLLKAALPAVVLVCALISLPLAFVGPPVLPYESTTTPAEFQAVTFAEAHIEGNWTSDDHLTRIGKNYYDAEAPPGPTYGWLDGAEPPTCPVLVRGSWPATGAQAFPADPIAVDEHELERFASTEQTLYTSGSSDQRLVAPLNASRLCGGV
ncbi:hypothetical protein [Natronosalvus caseinilyticus]|uniref:hypothetical protein n=1 Tax=Natronosalvus caseinilyticus TaxID=2953747 RepID=UPI0028AA0B0B|nr:hypothetical protein [Natronosalvus caseinilyticus]